MSESSGASVRRKLRRAWTWVRLARGYCRYCENHRNQDPELCDAHVRIEELEWP